VHRGNEGTVADVKIVGVEDAEAPAERASAAAATIDFVSCQVLLGPERRT